MRTLKILTILTLVLISSAIVFSSAILKDDSDSSGYSIGEEVEPFSLKDFAGKEVNLQDFPDAQGFIIIFTSKTCPFSRIYNRRINRLNDDYASQGFPVIAIDPGEDLKLKVHTKHYSPRNRRRQEAYPYLSDPNARIFDKFGAQNIPEVYLLLREEGKFVVKYKGAIDSNFRDSSGPNQEFLTAAVEALLKDQEIKVPQTRSIGCSVTSS